MKKFASMSFGLACMSALFGAAASCSSDGDASFGPEGGASAAEGGAGGEGAADTGSGGSQAGRGGAARGGESSTSGGAKSASGGAPGAGGEVEASAGAGGDMQAASGGGGGGEPPGPGGAAGAPTGSGGTAPECTGTHPNVEGELRFCDPGDCYCTDPVDTCFPGEVADACCNDAPECGAGGSTGGAGGSGPECMGTHPNVEEELRFCDLGDCYCSDPIDTCFSAEDAETCCVGTSDCGSEEEPGGVDCTGEHPITEPERTCEAGFCLCTDLETIDVCLPADAAEVCCPPEIELDCVE